MRDYSTILVTGKPGCGKTTLIKRLADVTGKRAGGFYTEEIRGGGRRQGFRLVTLDGDKATFAHCDIQSPYKVSKYFHCGSQIAPPPL